MNAPAFERQNRRRTTLGLAVVVACLLGILAWFLFQPSGAGSPGRAAKNAIFGPRVTDAVEQGLARRGSGNPSRRNGARTGGGSSGHRAQENSPSAQASGGDPGQRAPRSGTADQAAEGSAPNVQLPEDSGPDIEAPPPRSIGWLDRFFGRDDSEEPFQAGEGGIGTGEGTGNTNITVASSGDPVASPVTTAATNAAPFDPNSPPPSPIRPNSRVAPPSEATLNDNFERLLQQHRAGSGDLRISLMWSNKNDIDLHVEDPNGEEINYNHRQSSSGGALDIDMNANPPLRSPAVENVFWPRQGAPPGTYRVYVNHFRVYDRVDATPFTVRILIRGRTMDVPGTIHHGQAKMLVKEFTLAPGR